MANPHIRTYQEINYVIRRTFPDIPSQVDPEGFILADGVSLTKNVYNPANGKYELHIRDTKNNKWKSFDSADNPGFIEDAARCFAEFYNARKQQTVKTTDYMADFSKAYNGIRNLQTSLVKLVESVPGISTSAPVTTVKFLRIDNELTARQVTPKRNAPEIQVFESFFPEGDTKYMCGINILNKDGTPSNNIYRSRREALPALIRKYTGETKPAPVPEQDLNQLKYLIASMGSILAKYGASLEAAPGGLRLRTGEPGKESLNLTILDQEAK
jgi:hypothetical protein